MMTQEQIEEMLRNAGQVETPAPAVDLNLDQYLSRDEQDALGEMGNICMGTSATTMYMLLNKQVTITTPHLSLHTWDTMAAAHPLPLVVVEVQYTEGIDGVNLLLLKEYDVALITDLLMGGEGNIDPNNIVLDEISLSAIREVMNQMVGSSATSLASMLNKTIDISTPESKRVIISQEQITRSISEDEIMLKIAFRMEIEGLLQSEIMQVLPIGFAQKLAHELLNPSAEEPAYAAPSSAPALPDHAASNVYAPPTQDYLPQTPAPAPAQTPAPTQTPSQSAPPYLPPEEAAQIPYPPYQQPYGASPYPPQTQPQYAQPYPGAPHLQQPYAPYPPQPYPPYPSPPVGPYNSGAVRDANSVSVREVEYPTFHNRNANPGIEGIETENLWRLLDVPMEITIELGRSKKTVKQVLDLNVGAVVVLDKLAGELVEVMVNGIQVGRGEVVVIDDSYGVRITELNAKEINKLTSGNH